MSTVFDVQEWRLGRPAARGGDLDRTGGAASAPLVIKFGGTSLATPSRIRRATRRVRAHLRRGRSVAVVVSANGGATDRIVRLLGHVGGRAAPREADRALATGEDLSAALMASALCALGIPARSLRGGEAGVWAEGGFGGGRIADVDPAPLRALLRAGTVPVVAGFQGVRDDGETVTLGRGASDLSAVAIAAALDAECHIVTDVRGVFDRDPRSDPDARLIPRLDHRRLLRLSDGGAKVVQREAAAEALRLRVSLRIYHHAAGLDGVDGTIVTSTDVVESIDAAGVPFRAIALPVGTDVAAIVIEEFVAAEPALAGGAR